MPDTDQISSETAEEGLWDPQPPAAAADWKALAFDLLCGEAQGAGVVVLDPELRLLALSARCAELLDAQNPSSIEDLFRLQAERVAAFVKAAATSGAPVEREIEWVAAEDAMIRRLHIEARPLRVGEAVIATALLVREAWPTDAQGLETLAVEGRLRHVLDALASMTFVLDADGALLEANAAALRAANLQPTDVIGRNLADAYWWSWDAEAQKRLRLALLAARDGAVQRYQEKIRVGADRLLTIMLQIAPLRDRAGKVTQLACSAIDVSELVEMQERQALLAAELTHRVKNILTIVQALVSRTARRAPTKEALAASLQGRIAAMASAIGQLSRSHWTGYELDGVIAEQLEGYGADRVTLEGPRLRLSPKAALAFALIAFELGSNASKHGALSTPDGRVVILWRIEGGELAFVWREAGGPRVAPPGETGFGSTLVRNLAEGDLGAVVEMAFPPEGVEVRLQAPLARLRQAADASVALRANGADAADMLAGRRILVAEESPVIALDLSGLLEAAGARVVGPYGALADAAAALERERVDIALMNVEMRGESALPLARAAEAHGAALLFATAGESAEAARRAFPTAAIIAKPFSEAEILEALARLARR